MPDLSREDIKALGRAACLDIDDPHLAQLTYSLNALLNALDDINIQGLDDVESLPLIFPQRKDLI